MNIAPSAPAGVRAVPTRRPAARIINLPAASTSTPTPAKMTAPATALVFPTAEIETAAPIFVVIVW